MGKMKRFSMEQAADMEPDIVFHECEDKTVNKLMQKFSDRAIKSNNKHGNTIDQVNKNQIEWAVEALEEAIDMCVYLQRLIDMMLDVEQERRGNVRNLP